MKNETSNKQETANSDLGAVRSSALTPMHKMINYLCETGNYDLVDKANELLLEERKVIEKAHLHGLIHVFENPTTASEDYYKSTFVENTAF